VDREELLRVRERMAARGPDGVGFWASADERVAFAHRRLAIIELSDAGAQPMGDPDTGNQIVFNGEIYNYELLRRELVSSGAAMRANSDTEVLLKLYARYGAGMLPMLRGMFAFAIWDAREQQVFLARDQFGIKPLYVADDGRSLRFASQVKALLAANVDARPEPAGHAGFFLWGSVPEPYTLHRGIRAIPPGHWVRAGRGSVAAPKPFHNAFEATKAEAGPDTRQQRAAIVAAAVRDSVAAHMVSDVPVGVFLSAGLDSTMIAASASHLGKLRTLTLGFREYDGTPADEVPLASEAARTLRATHVVQRVSASEFAAQREQLLAAMDQPSIDGINTWFVAWMAAQQGLKVALSGIGGDELFGSYPSFRQVPRLRRSVSIAARVPAFGRTVRLALSRFSNLLPSAKYSGVLEYGGTLCGAYLLRRALFMPWELPSLMDAEMAAAGIDELDTLARLRASIEGIHDERLAISALEMRWYMKNQLLRDADWAGMAHSVEIRVPFVDTTLFRTMLAAAAFDTAIDKRMVAEAVAPQLPPAILRRPKTGFAVPIHQWLNPDAPPNVMNHRGWARVLYRRFAQN